MNKYEIIIPPLSASHSPAEIAFRKGLDLFESFLILSPHFDDAILSMGSLMAYLLEQGRQVEVINVFTQGSHIASPLTEKLLRQSGFNNSSEYFQKRAAEDHRALSSLGAIHVTNLDFIDAPWRYTDPDLPLYPQTTWNTYDKPETTLQAKLTAALKTLQAKKNKQLVFAPLARGRHNDHLIVRSVGSAIFSPVIYYSDFPYSQNFLNEEEFIENNHLSLVEWSGNYYSLKSAAILKYHTQLYSLFGNSSLKLPYECFYRPS